MISIVVVLSISLLILLLKYINLKKEVKKLYDVGTGRKGFYNYSYGFSYKCIVYINEIDRYTNGYSKITIDNIESISGEERAIKYAKDEFITLKKTNTIIWLETDMDIKNIRKEKLDKIKKSLKLF